MRKLAIFSVLATLAFAGYVIFFHYGKEPVVAPPDAPLGAITANTLAIDNIGHLASSTCNVTGTISSFGPTSTDVVIVVGTILQGSGNVTSVTWGGQSLTFLDEAGAAGTETQIWYGASTSASANNVVLTTNVSHVCSMTAFLFSGADETDPIDTNVLNSNGFNSTITTNLTPNDRFSRIIDIMSWNDGSQAATPTTGQTQYASSSLGLASYVMSVDSAINPPASTATTWTLPVARNFGHIVVAVHAEIELDVDTSAASGVTAHEGQINASVVQNEDNDITEHGFAWGTNSTLTGGDTATTTKGSFSGTGTFFDNLSSLTGDTTYYFRAYASSTANGIDYGTILSFTTDCDAAASFCTETFSTAGYTTWVVPSNVTSIDIACWGPGGGGFDGSGSGGGAGGGGGAFASSTEPVSAGQTIRLFIGAQAAEGTSSATTTASSTVPALIVAADAGRGATGATTQIGRGGLASISTGDVTNDGGNGGQGIDDSTHDGGGGGGGAGGPHGDGEVGANAIGGATDTGGAGGRGDATLGGTAGSAGDGGNGGLGGDHANGGGGGGGGDNSGEGGNGGAPGGGGGGGENNGGVGAAGQCTITYQETAGAATPGSSSYRYYRDVHLYTKDGAIYKKN